MKIIIDTNIVFSALLKTQTTFGQIIFNSTGIFEFYCPHYLRTEIRKHWDRLKRISKLTDKQLQESYEALLSKITFINEELIPQKVWEDAEKLTTGIDVDDTVFVALTKYVKGKLWSGDNTLQAGLKKKGYKAILTTPEIHKLWIKKREKLK
ncbi:MAG: PIN domain-containing protein [Cyclobacteriaceae bacterium]|nr:MAG: PIN domain-containing protein [Cyclobacteriaceae bacterium]